jgi:hypothetical protein
LNQIWSPTTGSCRYGLALVTQTYAAAKPTRQGGLGD